MNTKAVEATYEAGHVLYASKMNLISNDMFMGDYTKPGGIKLFKMDELETFAEAIKNNTKPIVTLLDGVNALKVAHQIINSF